MYLVSIIIALMSIGLLFYKVKTDLSMIDKQMLIDSKLPNKSGIKVEFIIVVLVTPIVNIAFTATVIFVIISTYEKLEEFLDNRLQEEEGEDIDE
jgi:large-conductance mechanosensitive channel